MEKKLFSMLFIFVLGICLTGCGSKYSDKKALWNNAKVGDYVFLESNSKQYTIAKEKSGYEKNQSIKTNELKLWRVINVNKDLTVDVVSEYLPQDEIIISGLIGYNNYVGLLNEIAFEYGNNAFVEQARNVGYSNQRENVAVIKSFNNLMSKKWSEIKKEESIDNIIELSTDDSYITDLELIEKTIGTILASPESTSEHKYTGYFRYLISSRDAEYNSLFPYIKLYVREIDRDSTVSKISKTEIYDCSNMNSNGCEAIPTVSERIRPILTLKHNAIIKSGDGSENSPYQLDID